MNKIVISGNMTKNPELRTSGVDLKVCSFSVAVKRPFSKTDEVDFGDCVAFRRTAEFIARYFEKGKPILVEGRLQSRKWQDKAGNNRTSWEVIVDNAEFHGGDRKAAAPAPVVDAEPFAGMEGTPFEMVDDFADIADLPA